jgi:hypothetical protein
LLVLEDRLCPSWGTPVNLGPLINLPGSSQVQVAISPDELSVYFASDRPGGFGGRNLWVSHRQSLNAPWGEPQNLGPTINSAGDNLGPDFSPDGHWLYFASDRPGGYGAHDIYRSYRADPHDDFGWQTPVNLGPGVNGPTDDADPCIFEDPATGTTTLYFASLNRPEGMGDYDIYASTLQEDGTFGPAVPVPELNTPFRETHPNVSRDGLTVYFTSGGGRGGLGGLDIWESTRPTTHDQWSPPVDLGAPIDTEFDDRSPYLSDDGNTLFFTSNRPGGFATEDVYMSTYIPVYTVTNLEDSGTGSLRQAIMDANAHHGANTIRFADGLHGTITLTSGQLNITDDLTIDGPGADQLTISGNHASRIFDISGGVMVTIAGLTITNGMAIGNPGDGGGILNDGSTLTVTNDVLSYNQAIGEPGQRGRGGAISNRAGAALTMIDSLLTHNQALGGSGGGVGAGAAIVNNSSSATIVHSTFMANQAIGGGVGAGIHNVMSTLTVSDSTFIGNQAIGGDGGGAHGGGINIEDGSTVTVSRSTFTGNEAIGGDGGVVSPTNTLVGFGRGGGIYSHGATLTVADSTFIGNRAVGGNGGSGGSGVMMGSYSLDHAIGGGILNEGTLVLSGSTFTGNQALGGSNASGGTNGIGRVGVSWGGALMDVGAATVTNSTFDYNEARGGSGDTGGSSFSLVGIGFGGGIAISALPGNQATLAASNVVLRHNLAVGGAGNATGTYVGQGIGGGLANDGAPSVTFGSATATVSDSTIADNQALGGQGPDGGSGGDALGGGMANLFGAVLTISGSTLTNNCAVGGDGQGGGRGSGGGLFNDGPSTYPFNLGAPTVLTVLGSTITNNEARGGAAGAGGSSAGMGAGGGIASASILTVLGSSLTHNWAIGVDGQDGANGGDGLGGGLYVAGGTVSVLGTTIDHNRAIGGDGDAGSNGGNGLGGGVYVAAGTVIVVASDISSNQALGGLGDGTETDGVGVGGGVYNLGMFVVDALSVIAHNHAADGNDDCFGCSSGPVRIQLGMNQWDPFRSPR